MKIAFHGAARTVTGSKHLLSLNNGKKYLLDCGMFQGMGRNTDAMNNTWGFEPSEVTHVILSHAHIDHSGLLPKLVKDGFTGNIFCTPATRELTEVLLEDSAKIQEDDTKYSNKKRALAGEPLLEPLYNAEDARAVNGRLKTTEYGQWTAIDENVEVLFTDAGHIIGSAAVHLKVKEAGKITQLSFSGDVGRYRDAILRSPEVFPRLIILLLSPRMAISCTINSQHPRISCWNGSTRPVFSAKASW